MDYRYLWAKKKRRNDEFLWLPLYVHLEDTANMAGLLWEHWLSDGVKESIYDSISKDNNIDEDYCKKLAMFLAYCHDIGKASLSFQYKKTFPKDSDLDSVIFEKLKYGGFEYKYDYIEDPYRHNVISEYLLNKSGVNPTISIIAGSHHGRISSKQALDVISEHEYQIYQAESKEDENYKKWECLYKCLINKALDFSGIDDLSNLPILSEKAQIIYSGLLILADWISSNEDYFPLISIDEINVSNNRLEEGFKKWLSQKTNPWKPTIEENRKMYKDRFLFDPSIDQLLLADLVKKIDRPGILIYEACTGSGKTEASLIATEIMATKSHKSGIFFALPSQATSNGIFSRMKKWLNTLSQLEKSRKSIRLIHGKSALNEEFTSINPSSNIYEEDGPGLSVNSYFAGSKLSILDDFTVGTIDQLLLMALKQKHLMLKHLGFSNKIVVVDEAHAYSSYMNTYLDQAIKWLAYYDVPVIILSATLPIKRRNDLIKSYLIGKGYKTKNIKKPEFYETEESYPLVTYTDGDNIFQFKDFEKKSSKKYEIIKISKQESLNIVKNIKENSIDSGIFGIIVNTVKKCQSLAKELIEVFGEDKVEVLHSSFESMEKIKKENRLLETIGKEGKRPKFKIIIGTQVIEQSLDIDFDVLYTDLAPMDLIIQRMGRLHRHSTHIRPARFKDPKVYVMDCGSYDFDEASTHVYSKYILMRTEYFLPNIIEIPKDVSNLVQKVYSVYDLNIIGDIASLYKKYKDEYETLIKNKESDAKKFRIDNPIQIVKADNTMRCFIANGHNASELSDVKASNKVRDACDSVEFICLQYKNGSYGYLGGGKALGKLTNSLAKDIAKHTIRLPSALTYAKKIDEIISQLEDFYTKNLKQWDEYSWLKGNLAIIFDKDGNFEIDDNILHYDMKMGLTYRGKE